LHWAAQQALQGERLKIPNKNSLFGFNDNISVLVVCHGVGDQSFVVVIAASRDGNAADNMAKNVHKRMSGVGCL
jgi:hypothetical protein